MTGAEHLLEDLTGVEHSILIREGAFQPKAFMWCRKGTILSWATIAITAMTAVTGALCLRKIW